MSATAQNFLQTDELKMVQEKARLLRIHSLRTDDGSRIRASDFLPFGGRDRGRNIFSCDELRSGASQCDWRRPFRSFEGTCGADSLCRAGGIWGFPRFKADDAEAS